MTFFVHLQWKLISILVILMTFVTPYIESNEIDPLLVFEDEDEACCILKWEPLVKLKDKHGSDMNKKAAPVHGIKIARTTIYHWYFVADPSQFKDFGVQSDALADHILYFPEDVYSGKLRKSENYDGIYVLSNPNKCKLHWTDVTNQTRLKETHNFYYPAWAKHMFTRTYPRPGVLRSLGLLYYEKYHESALVSHLQIIVYNGTERAKVDHKIVGESIFGHLPTHTLLQSVEVLGVDCRIAFQEQLNSELYEISLVGEPSKELNNETIAAQTIINNWSREDQSVEVELEADIKKSIQLTHETRLEEATDVSWSIEASASIGFLRNMFPIGVTISGSYEEESHEESFAESGVYSMEASETYYRFYQNLTSEADTSTTVHIITRSEKSSQNYIAKYRISPSRNMKMPKHKIISFFKRMGIDNIELENAENNTYIYSTMGSMKVSAGFDTQVHILTTRLSDRSILYEQRSDLQPV